MNSSNALIVIPARGGSKGVPRKNLRPLKGRPLIYYSIKAALSVVGNPRVVVTTDDEEIALFARRFGAEILMRPPELADDAVTMDPVIVHAVEESEKRWQKCYDVVITVQPTSPLVLWKDIEEVLAMFAADGTVETVMSAVDDRHLRWREQDGRIVPDYEKRVNRQQLPPTFRETGAVIACRRGVLATGTRIGSNIKLYLMDESRSVDIDNMRDIWICEQILSRKKIVINVIGNRQTGLGHAFRAVMLAHELIGYDVVFVCEESDDLAIEYITRHNYSLQICPPFGRLDTICGINPTMVINDILDTSADFVIELKKRGMTVVNFEDMGLGAEVADLVINALYPHQIPSEHILVGPRYFCLRDEFLHIPPHTYGDKVERLLVAFGGVDEANLSRRVLEVVGRELSERGIAIDVVLGPGYPYYEDLANMIQDLAAPSITLIRSTTRMSDYMARADMAVTSGGRTVLELTALHVPVVILCQNLRETTHKFSTSEFGIINLGLARDLTDEQIRDAVFKVVDSAELRSTMRRKSGKLNLREGKRRVLNRLKMLLDTSGGEEL